MTRQQQRRNLAHVLTRRKGRRSLASLANAFAEEGDAARWAGERALIIGFTHKVSKRLEDASLLNAGDRANA